MKKTFADIVAVNSKFCRSVNINQDLNDIEILKGLICPTSFRLVFESMIDNISTTGQSAFTWTGPYGAGKSSLALLLTAIFSKSKKLRDIGENIIGESMTKKLHKGIDLNKGWKVLPIMGDLKDTEFLIKHEIENDTSKPVKDIFTNFKNYLNENEGLLLIIDEMGKCLEYAGKYGSDIFFYQQLAEYASRSNGRFIVIGILHQSFGDYAKYLPFTMKDEWIKIQGRFVDMPINTAGEEQIELISRAIKTNYNNYSYIEPIVKKTVEVISMNKKIIAENTLIERFCKCWPINPIVIVLLCQMSRKKFGQNQRSIFSFLASGEPLAFRDFSTNHEYRTDLLYMPTNLFDYIRINLESTILASSDSRLWHIAIDGINKCLARGLNQDHIDIFKTIAVIDLFSSSSGIVANEELLKSSFQSIENDIHIILSKLKELSIIIFKKHTNAYSIFEGSDFNIDKALDEAYLNISEFDISKLEDIANFKPIIAKRYYHKYGSLQWFDVVLAPIDNCEAFLIKEYQRRHAAGLYVILLPETVSDDERAKEIVANNYSFPVIFTITENTRLVNEYLRELIAIEWIQKNVNELAGDSIARREVEDRKQILISYLAVQLNNILVYSKWYYNNIEENKKLNELSIWASQICEKKYSKAPIIKSELINRNKPSSNANAALYALVKNMVLSAAVKDLDIKGYTAEKGLYNILLKDTGIHRQDDKGIYSYYEPKKNSLTYLWEYNDEILKKGGIISSGELFDQWSKEPFGIKDGLFLFLLLSYILTRQSEIGVYREGAYIPEINIMFVENLLSNYKPVSLRYIKSNNQTDNIINTIITLLNELNQHKTIDLNTSPLIVARNLVSIIDNLHPWVLKTRTLSNKTTRLREIIKSANDPNKLIFDDIIKLFPIDSLYNDLKISIKELIDVFPAMMQSIGILLTSELDIPLATPTHLEKLRDRAKNIKGVTGDFKIDAFATRLSNFNATHEDISGIISLANNKPPRDWIDLDIENAKKEILQFCIEFKKAELYTKVKNRPASRQAIAFISGIGGKTNIVTGEFDILMDKEGEVNKLKAKLKILMKDENDISLILTALAETSMDYLKENNRE